MQETSQEKVELIIKDFLNGLIPPQISKKNKICCQSVKKILIRANVGFESKSKHLGKNLDFIKENYVERGAKYCSENLGISVRTVKTISNEFSIKREIIPSFDFDFENLMVDTPEFSYVLGLIWADGYVENSKKTKRVGITCVYDDLITLEKVFDKVGNWKKTIRNPPNRRKALQLRASSKKFIEWLTENDYRSKSYESADKILSKIPEHLQHYWFRGLVDGDGCFSLCVGKTRGHFVCASGFDQNWGYFENLCKNLQISYGIRRKKRFNKISQKINSYSAFVISCQKYLVTFGNYIYQNYENDGIGLQRKYDKFSILKNLFETRDERLKESNKRGIETRLRNLKNQKEATELAKVLEFNSHSL